MLEVNEKKDNKDLAVKRSAEALLKGAKMLGYACPVCHNPLYEYPSKQVRCVVCDKEVKIVSSEEEAKKIETLYNEALKDKEENKSFEEQDLMRRKEKDTREKKKGKESKPSKEIEQAIQNIEKKILELTEKIQVTMDYEEILKATLVIKKLVKTLKELRD